ncbi:protein-export chaperone SecB [Porphyromonas bennonis]|uniref:protein-export chaperone SecB n=1 Tax=Porphyromonas bennonis TaxID=501496 RepID=UPI000375C39F|nr:protein-export chaperone SecB [Porphyromonas bennonis]
MAGQGKAATFTLKSYRFLQVSMDFEAQEGATLSVSFDPYGEYSKATGEYKLRLITRVSSEEKEFISTTLQVVFGFTEPIELSEIPDYFYPNCMAIVFPYVRSFLSTLSLQANVPPIILPIINFSDLQGLLKRNTKEVE